MRRRPGPPTLAPPVALFALNPLDLRGPEFLSLYAGCFVAALVMALILRRRLRVRSAAPAKVTLDPYLTACLAESANAAANVAICNMVNEGCLDVVKSETTSSGAGGRWRVVATPKPFQPRYRLEASLYEPAFKDGGATFKVKGGWIDSPAGAYAIDPSLTGRASFGFTSRYQPGATVPTGVTRFRFQVADLHFQSESYEWLVVAGARAQFKGTGTINGAGNYGFMLTAIDGQLNGGGGVDKFRIKIWDKNNGGAVVKRLCAILNTWHRALF